MLSNKECLAFFHKIKNKEDLFNLFVTYLCANDFLQSIPLSILLNNENEIFKIANCVTKVFECNHKEGDTSR